MTERKQRPLNRPQDPQGEALKAPAKALKMPAALLYADALPEDLVEVGYVGAAYGIRGWIKVQPHANDASALLHARRWWLLAPPQAGLVAADAQQAQPVCVKIAQSREHSGTVVANAAGVADRNLAEALRGRRVWIRRADFPAPEDDEFYWVDLIGCSVSNEQGELLGEVSGLIDNGAHQILQIAYALPDGKAGERLIPFVDAFLRTVDTAGKRIVVDWGLDY
ncbi:ribosome maturation factor RimM [Cupriavidus oxalaticus]|uniref:Ribosome maturation factor RimM n=2 Tax=Cupriavidus oxalaticus TaxID=96344 RepID=A0A976BEU6_9BURK|nr:ribosome maturation factor RimM [Cupriavidus oxalaticus]QRQ95009.1 ribosome maturation factor RimM [Cupriavidus oxalaticus]SPC16929.1 Ribosome maturation factor RimM [Cupriavidus oxalaticus]